MSLGRGEKLVEDSHGHLAPMVKEELPKPVDSHPYDRRQAICNAVDALANYLATWGSREEQGRTAWAVLVPKGILEDIEQGVEHRLQEMWEDAAKERALSWKADELNGRY